MRQPTIIVSIASESPRACACTSEVIADRSASLALNTLASSALIARNTSSVAAMPAMYSRRTGAKLTQGLSLLAAQFEEALDRRLLVIQTLGERAGVFGGGVQEVLDAPLRVIRQGIHAR